MNTRLFEQITTALLADLLGVTTCQLGVYLVSGRQIARLNEKFLRQIGPTDVIAFDYYAEPGGAAHTVPSGGSAQPGLWGDIFICVDEAVNQARRFNTTWQAELVRYLVHGLLHLVGYNDHTPAARRRMKKQEDKLLQKLVARYPLDELGRKAGHNS